MLSTDHAHRPRMISELQEMRQRVSRRRRSNLRLRLRPPSGKDKKIKKQDIKKPDPKKPASTGKRPVNQVPKEPPAEPKGKDAEEEEAGPSQGGRPKRVPRAK